MIGPNLFDRPKKPLWSNFIKIKTLKSFTDGKSRCILCFFYLRLYWRLFINIGDIVTPLVGVLPISLRRQGSTVLQYEDYILTDNQKMTQCFNKYFSTICMKNCASFMQIWLFLKRGCGRAPAYPSMGQDHGGSMEVPFRIKMTDSRIWPLNRLLKMLQNTSYPG